MPIKLEVEQLSLEEVLENLEECIQVPKTIKCLLVHKLLRALLSKQLALEEFLLELKLPLLAMVEPLLVVR